VRFALVLYLSSHPGFIHSIVGGSDCKLLLPAFESERHPDLSVYRTEPPEDENDWINWIPDIVVEVVSPRSEERDYREKREEYLELGIREYWIVDTEEQAILVLRRAAGRWSERWLRAPKALRTRLLPGFELPVAAVFA
jgi:Uma2 family endonuclease